MVGYIFEAGEDIPDTLAGAPATASTETKHEPEPTAPEPVSDAGSCVCCTSFTGRTYLNLHPPQDGWPKSLVLITPELQGQDRVGE